MAAVRNIESKIKCEYSKKCKDYCIWHGGDKFSKCVNCKNNKYKDFRKESYYKSKSDGVYAIVFGILFILLMLWLFQ